ncbi:MAG: hypothetical protein ACO22B_07720 [Ilumatobacteraceae bacterium]
MTIRKGVDWGEPGRPPAGLRWFDDDRSASDALNEGATALGLSQGDMARTLGAGRASSSVEFSLDVMRLSDNHSRSTFALSHVVVRRRRLGWWFGGVTVVMNAQYLGTWDVAPRGHPNDGRAEQFVVDPTMPLRQRLAARRRLPLGSHLPHPKIASSSARHLSVQVPPKARIDVDGRCWFVNEANESYAVVVEVVPDAITVWTLGADQELPLSP